MKSAMSSKQTNWHGETRCAHNNYRKTRYACVLEAHEKATPRIGRTQPRDHEDLIAEKRLNSLSLYNPVHKLILMSQVREIPDAKGAVDKGCEKLEKLPAWKVTKVMIKREVIQKSQKEGNAVHFATLMALCHLKNSQLEQRFQKYRGPVVLRGDVVKDDSGFFAVFTEQGASALQMTDAKVQDVVARRPGCAGQASSISLHPSQSGRFSNIAETS